MIWMMFWNMILVSFIGSSYNAQDVKTWRRNTNFDNPHNWETGIVPCKYDRVIFPASSPVAVYMPESFSVAEIVLPLNGELIFPANATLSFSKDIGDGSCSGKDVLFQVNDYSWFHPENWNITSDRAFPRISSRRNIAVPHAFQIPCRLDKVHFPAKTSFRIHNDFFPSTTVAALQIGQKQYTNEEFKSLLSSSTGKLLFPDYPGVQISPQECNDKTGCVCGNDNPVDFSANCALFEKNEALECSDPIELVGHCFPICGVKIIIKYKSGFDLNEVMNLYQNVLSKIEFWNVDSFTSKTYDGLIQSVFVDNSHQKGLAKEVAKLIHDTLTSGREKYKLHSAERQYSENWNPDIPLSDRMRASGMSSGGVAAIVIVIILMGIAVAVYIYKRRQIPGFSFARFDLRADRIELELGTTPHDDLQPEDSVSDRLKEKDNAFDNPVYGKNISSEIPENSQEGSFNDFEGNFVENPMAKLFDDLTNKQEKS